MLIITRDSVLIPSVARLTVRSKMQTKFFSDVHAVRQMSPLVWKGRLHVFPLKSFGTS